MANPAMEAFRREVDDARLMLDFAVSSGFKSADDRKVPDEIILAINRAEDLLATEGGPAAPARAELEKAYRDLSLLVAPVTADSLKATSQAYGSPSWISLYLTKLPDSYVVFWKLVFWSCVFVLISFAGNLFNPTPPLKVPAFIGDGDGVELVKRLLSMLEPFTYGGIGACACLLKTAMRYILNREFDTRRMLDYYCRIVLGVVAGGVVVILIAELSVAEALPGAATGNGLPISAKALGLLAGYNTGFLFNAIERLAAAILPKTDEPAEARTTPVKPVVVGDVSLNDLLDQLKAAGDPAAKAAIQAIIDKIKDRI
jgi:hypothetical protein